MGPAGRGVEAFNEKRKTVSYKPAIVSPSSLAAVEKCPRFRPNGEETEASADGTLYHEHMESIVQLPREEWDGYVEKTEMSNDMRWLVKRSVAELSSLVLEKLESVKDFRIKYRKGDQPFLKTKRLKPGLYTEVEVELGGGRHGYIDLLVVPSEGPCYVVDWKSSRNSHDYTLQITRYAIAVNDLCPLHDQFICCVVAPRLDEESNLRLAVGPDELKAARARIASIEAVADRSANDPTVPGCPSESCQYCHWSGMCQYQSQYVDGASEVMKGQAPAQVALANLEKAEESGTESQVKMAKTVFNSVNVFKQLTAPGGVFEGVRLTLMPQSPAERGLRRLVLKTMANVFEAVKKDDARWVAQNPGTVELPGYKIQTQRGKASVPPENMEAMKKAFIAKYALDDQEVAACSEFSTSLLIDHLVDQRGMKKTATKAEVEKVKEPFTVRGAEVVKWVASEKATKLLVAKEGEL